MAMGGACKIASSSQSENVHLSLWNEFLQRGENKIRVAPKIDHLTKKLNLSC